MHFKPSGNGKGGSSQPGERQHTWTADNDATPDPAGSKIVNRANTAAKTGGSIVVALGAQQADQGEQPQHPTDQRMLDRQIQAAIGEQLRVLYNDAATAPVPESFIKLLDELAAKADKR